MDHSSMDTSDTTSSDNSTMTDSEHMSMKAYLHFTTGDYLLFDTIAPTSAGATVGACFFIFFLAILERWLRSFRRSVDLRMETRALRLLSEYGSDEGLAKTAATPQPQYLISHRLASGVLTGVEVTLHYALMLIVMTFNAAFIISAVVGAIVGDGAFRL